MKATASFALAGLIFLASARAEKNPPENPSQQESGSLATAKQSFDRLKAPQISLGEKREITPLPAPDFEAVPAGPMPRPSAQPKPAPEAGTQWLVEGVLGKGESAEKARNSRDGADAKGLGRVSDLATATKISGSSVGEKPVLAGLKGASNNPLEPYLASWISPQDRGLVQTNSAAVTANSARVDSTGKKMAGPLSEYHGSAVATDRKDFRPANPQNPYLQVQASSSDRRLTIAPPQRGQLPAPTGNSAPGPGSVIAKNPPPPVSHPGDSGGEADPRSDLLRASEQQKYFRQLKRF